MELSVHCCGGHDVELGNGTGKERRCLKGRMARGGRSCRVEGRTMGHNTRANVVFVVVGEHRVRRRNWRKLSHFCPAENKRRSARKLTYEKLNATSRMIYRLYFPCLFVVFSRCDWKSPAPLYLRLSCILPYFIYIYRCRRWKWRSTLNTLRRSLRETISKFRCTPVHFR